VKILHTAAFYPPRSGGAEEVVRQLSERLVARGHSVTVATTAIPERTFTELNGVAVRGFMISSPFNHTAFGISGEVDDFMRFVATGNFDIVMNYAAQTWGTDLTCRLLGKLKAKTVLAACGFSGLTGRRRLIYRNYFRRLPRYLKLYDAVVYHVNGYIDEKFGRAHGVRHSLVIPNAVDAAEFAAPQIDFRQKYNIHTKYMVLAVGNHFRNKGHARIIEAFHLMKRKDTTLVIIGRDIAPRLRSCWRSCQRAYAGKVVLVQSAPRCDVSAAFAAADVFVSGSYFEVFPLVLLESMASQTPFVSFSAGNAAQLAGGVIVNSAREMATGTQRLLDCKALRGKLGCEGKQQQEQKFEWETVVDQYESLYQSLLARRA